MALMYVGGAWSQVDIGAESRRQGNNEQANHGANYSALGAN